MMEGGKGYYPIKILTRTNPHTRIEEARYDIVMVENVKIYL
jgi:hypothetical protein